MYLKYFLLNKYIFHIFLSRFCAMYLLSSPICEVCLFSSKSKLSFNIWRKGKEYICGGVKFKDILLLDEQWGWCGLGRGWMCVAIFWRFISLHYITHYIRSTVWVTLFWPHKTALHVLALHYITSEVECELQYSDTITLHYI